MSDYIGPENTRSPPEMQSRQNYAESPVTKHSHTISVVHAESYARVVEAR